MIHLNVAEQVLALVDVKKRGFPDWFMPFLKEGGASPHDILVIPEGADESLLSLQDPEGEPWIFKKNGDDLCILRRDDWGRITWKISFSEKNRTARISWHPVQFKHIYCSYELAWRSRLGMIIVGLSLSQSGGVIFHGSASVIDGKGVLCLGRSGAGKSTISQLIDQSGHTVLSDERAIVRYFKPISYSAKFSPKFKVFGSPWPSSGMFSKNESVGLSRIFFLEHGPDNCFSPISKHDAVTQLLHASSIIWQIPELFDPCLKMIEDIISRVPVAVLSFKPDEDVVDVIRQDLAADREIV